MVEAREHLQITGQPQLHINTVGLVVVVVVMMMMFMMIIKCHTLVVYLP